MADRRTPARGRAIAVLPCALVAVAMLAAGCGSSTPQTTVVPSTAPSTTVPSTTVPSTNLSYTVTVTAHAGPTCPVERPDQPCPDVPVQGTVTFSSGGVVAASGRTDANGTYSVGLPSGTYQVEVDTGAMLPRCEPVEVTVIDRAVTVDVSCDTGIR